MLKWQICYSAIKNLLQFTTSVWKFATVHNKCLKICYSSQQVFENLLQFTTNVWKFATVHNKCLKTCYSSQQVFENLLQFTTSVWKFATVHNKCLKIPPPTSVHFATRERRSNVFRLIWSSRFFVWAVKSKTRVSNSSRLSIFAFHPTPQTKL